MSIFARALTQSDLPKVHCLLLQVTYAADTNPNLFDDTDLHRFAQEAISKQVSEVYGFIGCLEKGAFIAAHHHARASVEIAAGVAYMVSKPSKIEKRLRKYFEFDELSRFNAYHRLLTADRLGILEKVQNAEGVDFDSRLEAWRSSVADWINLYGLNPEESEEADVRRANEAKALAKVKGWHHPANIDNLISELDVPDSMRETYAFLSHGTHLSPYTKHLSGNTPIGLPLTEDSEIDFALLNRLIGVSMLGLKMTIHKIETKLEVDFNVDWPYN